MMLQGVLAVSDLPLVSMDFKKSDVSTTIDSSLTMVMGDDMVKVCLLQRFKHIVMHRLPYNRHITPFLTPHHWWPACDSCFSA